MNHDENRFHHGWSVCMSYVPGFVPDELLRCWHWRRGDVMASLIMDETGSKILHVNVSKATATGETYVMPSEAVDAYSAVAWLVCEISKKETKELTTVHKVEGP